MVANARFNLVELMHAVDLRFARVTHWFPGCAEDDARWASPLTLALSHEGRGDKASPATSELVNPP